jgi:hypothetical protein
MNDELTAGAVQTRIRQILKDAENRAGRIASSEILKLLRSDLERLAGDPPTHATVQLFKAGGKWYTDESWRIPEGAIGPWDMASSPDFHTFGGPVLVETQEPWGYPFLIMPGPEAKQ